MEEWKEYRLGDIVEILDSKRIPLSSMQRQNMRGPYPYYGAQSIIDHINDYIFDGEYLILAEDGENLKSRKSPIAQIVKGKFWLNNHAHILKENGKVDLYLLNAIINRSDISGYITGSAQPKLNQDNMAKIKLTLPPLLVQKKIAGILSALDGKIETNRKINARLEELAQAIFKSWFIDFTPFGGQMPQDWEIKSLSKIASYLNGLAMQKYPPLNKEDCLPVLKIKELGDGKFTKNSDSCSKINIGTTYIIENGDIIFSWSGTLLVEIWTGGKCGLNQHLFKVTSNKYPKWFYYFWTLHHNENFKRIAKDKAVTMGHIKREELDKAIVYVPSMENFEKIDSVMSPILQQIISTSLESARLSELRDTLLPKLMSGEIKV